MIIDKRSKPKITTEHGKLMLRSLIFTKRWKMIFLKKKQDWSTKETENMPNKQTKKTISGLLPKCM